MSNNPGPAARGGVVRWILTGGLLVLAIPCVVWIVSLRSDRNQMAGSPAEIASYQFLPFAALDVLALVALAVWILRPPSPGALGFFGRWVGKVLLFLGLAAAVIVFFFVTCLARIPPPAPAPPPPPSSSSLRPARPLHLSDEDSGQPARRRDSR